MISIVVCSINSDFFNNFKNNVTNTIGTEFEIIKIDNLINLTSIADAYNSGFEKAQGEVICFCHEDIAFENFGWGELLYTYIKSNNDVGLVGVAGAVYKSAIPSAWVAIPVEYYRVNMLQKCNDGSIESHQLKDGKTAEVAVLDGCMIAGRKEVFKQFPWNSNLLKDFHLYDLDMSIRVGQYYKLIVTPHIITTHLSEGNFNLKWLKDSENLHRHYKHYFPLSVSVIRKKEIKSIEYFTLNAHVRLLLRLNQPLRKILYYTIKMFLLFPFKSQNIYLMKHILSPKKCE